MTRFYLVEFVDGDHAWAEGRDGFDAAYNAATQWGIAVYRYAIAGCAFPVWQRVTP